MTPIDIPELLQASAINTISGLIQNIFYIILGIWAVKTLIRNVPKWIDKYEKVKVNERAIESARNYFERNKG